MPVESLAVAQGGTSGVSGSAEGPQEQQEQPSPLAPGKRRVGELRWGVGKAALEQAEEDGTPVAEAEVPAVEPAVAPASGAEAVGTAAAAGGRQAEADAVERAQEGEDAQWASPGQAKDHSSGRMAAVEPAAPGVLAAVAPSAAEEEVERAVAAAAAASGPVEVRVQPSRPEPSPSAAEADRAEVWEEEHPSTCTAVEMEVGAAAAASWPAVERLTEAVDQSASAVAVAAGRQADVLGPAAGASTTSAIAAAVEVGLASERWRTATPSA